MKNIINNKRAQILISSFVRIYHDMNIQLIVKGVETKEQFELLRELKWGYKDILLINQFHLRNMRINFYRKIIFKEAAARRIDQSEDKN